MGIDLGHLAQTRGRRTAGWRRALVATLTALALVTTFGCEARREHETSGAPAGEDSTATSRRSANTPHRTPATGRKGGGGSAASRSTTGATDAGTTKERSPSATLPSGGNHVRLVQRGCVQFEPQWTTIHVGQTLTWHSELAVPVTIHIAAGAFEGTEFIVRAGQSLTTGPARAPGSFPISSRPAACQGAPLGPRGSGPGVTVEGTPGR